MQIYIPCTIFFIFPTLIFKKKAPPESPLSSAKIVAVCCLTSNINYFLKNIYVLFQVGKEKAGVIFTYISAVGNLVLTISTSKN